VCSRFAASAQERGVAPACLLAVYEKNVSDVARRIEVRLALTDRPNPHSPTPALQPRSLRCVCKLAALLSYVHNNDVCLPQAAEAQADMFRTKVYQIKQQRAASKVRSTPPALFAPPPPSRHPLPHQIRPTNFGQFVACRP